MIKKWICEFVGTMLLVIFGCGTAVAINTCFTNVLGLALPFTVLVIALAFGLVLTAIVYSMGKVSGAHVNPAVSVACLVDGRIGVVECIEYIVLQILGGIAGAAVLMLIFGSAENLGANGFDALSAIQTYAPSIKVTALIAFLVEAILTFIFVLVVLATTKKDNAFAGVAIGLTLTLVHIFGIVFTGTSVNPARSIGPALLTGGEALSQLWVFILAPLVGGILAALFYRFVLREEPKNKLVEATEEAQEAVKNTAKKVTKKSK